MKRNNLSKAATIIGLAGFTTLAAYGQNGQYGLINVSVNGQNVVFNGTQPQMMGNYVMVPLRGVFERLGATVDWREYDQTVIAHRGKTRVELKINNNEAMVNGRTVNIAKAPVVYQGSTMVPIRFISESLGAFVDWDATASLVSINTQQTYSDNPQPERPTSYSMQPRGTVLPVRLDDNLSSDESRVGDRFTATIDTNGNQDYFGIPQGTRFAGHVNFAQPRKGDTPGVLGLEYDAMIMPDGTRIPVDGTLTGLDRDSVTNRNGRLTTKKMNQKKDDMKYVGTGAGTGVVLALVTKKNVVTNALIGGALGYLYQNLIGSKNDVKNVRLDRGSSIGLRLDSQLQVPRSN